MIALVIVALCLACTYLATGPARLMHALDGHSTPDSGHPTRRPGRHSRVPRPATATAGPEEEPVHPVTGSCEAAPGIPPAMGAASLSRNVRYPALNPRLYETGEMPGISQAAADEMWWML